MNKWSNIYQWSLLITTALIPSGIYEATLAFVALSGLCWLIQKRYADIDVLTANPQFLFSLLFYTYVFFSALFSVNRGDAFSSMSVYFPLLFFPLFVGQSGIITLKLISKIEKIFLYSTVLSMLVLLIYALADYLISGEIIVRLSDADYSKFSSFGLTRLYGNFHPTYFSMFVNHSIFIVLQLTFDNYRQKKKLILALHLAIFIFLSLSLFLLNSMMGILVFLLILFYYGIVVLRRLMFSTYLRMLIGTVLIAFSAALIYFNPLNIAKLESIKIRQLKATDNYVERNLLTIRLAKWDTHLLIIRRHFLFGTTEGDIKAIRKATYLEKGYNDLALHNYNAHNQYLEVFATHGLIGFLFLAGMIITAFLRKRTRSFYLFMLIVLVTWLTESTWEMQQGFNYIMFFFVLYTAPLTGAKPA